jgi:hypothetical protein
VNQALTRNRRLDAVVRVFRFEGYEIVLETADIEEVEVTLGTDGKLVEGPGHEPFQHESSDGKPTGDGRGEVVGKSRAGR